MYPPLNWRNPSNTKPLCVSPSPPSILMVSGPLSEARRPKELSPVKTHVGDKVFPWHSLSPGRNSFFRAIPISFLLGEVVLVRFYLACSLIRVPNLFRAMFILLYSLFFFPHVISRLTPPPPPPTRPPPTPMGSIPSSGPFSYLDAQGLIFLA